ncbi:MAG: peptidoglycan-binding domain-containing protein, partial [Alphaproteobacteria bacterium]
MKFDLKHAVGANVDMHVDDIVTTKTALNRLGYYKLPEWGIKPWTDNEMFTAIGDFQRDHGLRVDEYMDKDGRTARRIERALGEREAEERR